MHNITAIIMQEMSDEGWATPAECNDGYCGHFADNIVRKLGKGRVLSTDTVIIDPAFGRHEWVYVDGRHYDSETPYGVTDPHDLGYFCRREGRPMPPTPWAPDADADSRDDLTETMEGSQIDLHHAYEVFRRSYEKDTGSAWTEGKFISRDLRRWMTLCEVKLPNKDSIAIWSMMNRKFGKPLGVGGHRIVWGNDRYVFKVPLSELGYSDNIREAEMFQDRANQPFPLARCKLIYLKRIPILVMESSAVKYLIAGSDILSG